MVQPITEQHLHWISKQPLLSTLLHRPLTFACQCYVADSRGRRNGSNWPKQRACWILRGTRPRRDRSSTDCAAAQTPPGRIARSRLHLDSRRLVSIAVGAVLQPLEHRVVAACLLRPISRPSLSLSGLSPLQPWQDKVFSLPAQIPAPSSVIGQRRSARQLEMPGAKASPAVEICSEIAGISFLLLQSGRKTTPACHTWVG